MPSPDDGGAEIEAYAQLYGTPPPGESRRWQQQPPGSALRFQVVDGGRGEVVAGPGLTIEEDYGFDVKGFLHLRGMFTTSTTSELAEMVAGRTELLHEHSVGKYRSTPALPTTLSESSWKSSGCNNTGGLANLISRRNFSDRLLAVAGLNRYLDLLMGEGTSRQPESGDPCKMLDGAVTPLSVPKSVAEEEPLVGG